MRSSEVRISAYRFGDDGELRMRWGLSFGRGPWPVCRPARRWPRRWPPCTERHSMWVKGRSPCFRAGGSPAPISRGRRWRWRWCRGSPTTSDVRSVGPGGLLSRGAVRRLRPTRVSCRSVAPLRATLLLSFRMKCDDRPTPDGSRVGRYNRQGTSFEIQQLRVEQSEIGMQSRSLLSMSTYAVC